MKKLILLALAFVMCGCVPITPDSVVTRVEKTHETQTYTNGYKYIVTTDNGLCFCTNESLTVGDTIQITKKK